MSCARRPTILVATVAVVAALLLLGSAAQARTMSCRTSGRTVDENSVARLFNFQRDGTVYGCVKNGGAIRNLAGLGDLGRYDNGTRNHVLGGRFAAYVRYSCDPDQGCAAVAVVRDLRTNKTRRTPPTDQNATLLPSVDGDLLYAGSKQVAYLPRRGPARTLDASAGVDPFSLARRYNRVFWVNAGTARTAVIGE